MVTVSSDLTKELMRDKVVDKWMRLVPKNVTDKAQGSIHCVFTLQTNSESPPLQHDPLHDVFFYQKGQFQPGDLLLFSGCGPLAAASKLLTGSRYTHAGLVVDIPDPFTGRTKRLLFEVTEWSR